MSVNQSESEVSIAKLTELLTNFIKEKTVAADISGTEQIRTENSPLEISKKIDLTVNSTGASTEYLMNSLLKIVEESVDTNHPYFMNQMYGKQNPLATLGDILTTLLNTSMYTYEVAPVMTMIEKEVIDKLCSLVWGTSQTIGDGVFTPGSSISNMTAMMMARNAKFPKSSSEGMAATTPFSIFVSDQAHYSFLKGARFLGYGERSIVKVKSDEEGKIDIVHLATAIELEKESGRIPLMLVGITGTTFAGKIDKLEPLAEIAKQHEMWFHVDGAYGASLMFSDKERSVFKGVERADSVSWSLHKMMGVPLVCAAFLTKERGLLNNAFSSDAEYLFHDNDDYDLGHKSLQCGRRVDALKLWLPWKSDGDIGFQNRVESQMKNARFLADVIKTSDQMELFMEPESPIVCFRFKENDLPTEQLNQLNKDIRDSIFTEGKMMFNYSSHLGTVYLRTVISDPEMTENQLTAIIETIRKLGSGLLKTNYVVPSKSEMKVNA